LEYGKKTSTTFLEVASGRTKADDWLLSFFLSDTHFWDLGWMYVDFVVPVYKSETGLYDRACPFRAIQANSLSRYPLPPFPIDSDFRKAFRAAIKEFGHDELRGRKSLKPPQRLLNSVATRLR